MNEAELRRRLESAIAYILLAGEELSGIRDTLDAKGPKLMVVENYIVPPGGCDWQPGLRVENANSPNAVRIWCPTCIKNFEDYDIRQLDGKRLCNCIECGSTWYAKKEGNDYFCKLSKEGSDGLNESQ